METLAYADNMFGQNRVLLECGHQLKSNGMYRARCNHCAKEQEQCSKA